MLRGLTLLLLACFAATTVSAQEIALRADCGGWKPPAALRARAMALKGLGGKALAEAVQKLEKEGGAALRIRVCRAGLRLADDRAAFVCATRLDWEHLDLREIERVIALCLKDNRYARPGTLVDFDRLRYMIGGREIPRILANFPPGPWNAKPTEYLAELHRQCMAEHIPALVALIGRPEAEVRDEAADNLRLVAVRTDRHLDQALRGAATIEGILIATGPERALRPDEWPPALRALVFGLWPADQGPLDAVERRSVLSRRALPEDEARLVLLVERSLGSDPKTSSLAAARNVLLRAVRTLHTPATTALLRRVALSQGLGVGLDHDPAVFATAALAARGEAGARDRLVKRAATDDTALALWFELEPPRAAAWFESRLLGRANDVADRTLERWTTLEAIRREFLLDWPDTPLVGLAGRAAASPRPGLALLRIARIIPGCVTRELVEAAVERLKGDEFPAVTSDDFNEHEVALALGVAEAAAPASLRRKLRAWANEKDPSVRGLARCVLLKIGDPPSGPLLARWIEDRAPEPDGTPFNALPCHDLPLSPCPQVRGLLRNLAREALADPEDPDLGPFVGLAILHGLPHWTASAVARDHEPGNEKLDPRRAAMILDGRVDEALRDWFEGAGFVPIDIWQVDRPEVRAFLRRLQREREHGLYADATAALACLGEAAARRETLAAFRAGRYLWLDSLGQELPWALLGRDVERMAPFWIDQLESNCCRFAVAVTVLEDCFDEIGSSDFGNRAEGWATPASFMRRWWRQHRGATFVWSRLAERYIPVMPD